jgi:hypothetical protein
MLRTWSYYVANHQFGIFRTIHEHSDFRGLIVHYRISNLVYSIKQYILLKRVIKLASFAL